MFLVGTGFLMHSVVADAGVVADVVVVEAVDVSDRFVVFVARSTAGEGNGSVDADGSVTIVANVVGVVVVIGDE